MMRERLNKLASRLPKWKRIQNRMMMSIAAQIADLIDEKFNSRREFADSLGKKESEVSKWLSGNHNFTLKSLSKIEEKLGTQFIFTLSEINDRLYPYGFSNQELFQSNQILLTAILKTGNASINRLTGSAVSWPINDRPFNDSTIRSKENDFSYVTSRSAKSVLEVSSEGKLTNDFEWSNA
jgi:transcriptional regulator with XRE-family HTH domain